MKIAYVSKNIVYMVCILYMYVIEGYLYRENCNQSIPYLSLLHHPVPALQPYIRLDFTSPVILFTHKCRTCINLSRYTVHFTDGAMSNVYENILSATIFILILLYSTKLAYYHKYILFM